MCASKNRKSPVSQLRDAGDFLCLNPQLFWFLQVHFAKFLRRYGLTVFYHTNFFAVSVQSMNWGSFFNFFNRHFRQTFRRDFYRILQSDMRCFWTRPIAARFPPVKFFSPAKESRNRPLPPDAQCPDFPSTVPPPLPPQSPPPDAAGCFPAPSVQLRPISAKPDQQRTGLSNPAPPTGRGCPARGSPAPLCRSYFSW